MFDGWTKCMPNAARAYVEYAIHKQKHDILLLQVFDLAS